MKYFVRLIVLYFTFRILQNQLVYNDCDFITIYLLMECTVITIGTKRNRLMLDRQAT